MPRRRILITGATDGIGLALANLLARDHDLLLTGRKAPEIAEPLLPTTTYYVQADQSMPADAASAIAGAVENLGWDGIDYAVLNAGTGFVTNEAVEKISNIDQTIDANLVATIAIAHAIAPQLLSAKGSLGLIGSVAHKGAKNMPAYASSKAALHGFARALRAEWKGRARVQIIHPGPTKTEMHEKAGLTVGAMRALFLSTDDMARMIRSAMASNQSPITASWLRYLSGGAYLGKRLR